MPDAESSFAKENGCAVLSVLDDQSLRAHGQNFIGCARQVAFLGQHLRFGIVNQKHIDQFQGLGEFSASAVDPVIHGVAAGQADTVHVLAHIGLQGGLNVCQKQILAIFVFLRNARLKLLEDVEIGKRGFGFVEIVGVGTTPTECFALGALDSAGIDSSFLEHVFVFRCKIVSDHRHYTHLCEIAGGKRKVGCRTAEDPFHASRRRRDVIKGNRTDYDNAHSIFH